MTRQKFFEICLVALLSAVISTLQGILTQYTAHPLPPSDPAVAMSVGGLLSFFRNIKSD